MFSRIKTRARSLLRKSEMEAELNEELRYHIEEQTELNIRLGMSRGEARHAALRSFGGVEQAKERSRDELLGQSTSQGDRIANGARAEAGDVLRMVICEGFKLTFIGLSLGLTAAFAFSRFIASQLFGVTATDPLTYAGVASLLAAVALLACYLPARRAAKTEPIIALKCE